MDGERVKSVFPQPIFLPQPKQETELDNKSKKLLSNLETKLPNFFSKENGFKERFQSSCQKVKKVYEQGGRLGDLDLDGYDGFDHNWHHIQTDIEMVAKILPGFLEKHRDNLEIGKEDIENLLWATLFHDIGWLMTSDDRDKFSWGGEKFFSHCQDGAERITQILSDKDFLPGAEPERINKISQLIKRTEFNPLDEQEQVVIDKENPRLGDVLRAADTLSYFCDPNDIPRRVQALFKELQATARAEDELTNTYFQKNKEIIAGKLGLSEKKIEKRFQSGRLTIGDLKFPGQSLIEFVAGEYLPAFREKFEVWLNYVNQWYGENQNKDRNNYYSNIAKVRAIQESLQKPILNPLAYFEASLMGRDLREAALTFDLNLNIQWDEVDKRMLGVNERDIFKRLVTKEIKELLQAAPNEKRADILAFLLTRIGEKYRIKRENGKESQDVCCLAIAPFAYQNILTPDQIFTVFKNINDTNQKRKNEAPLLKPVWTIRRDADFERDENGEIKWDDYAEKIKNLHQQGLLDKVILAGREITDFPLQLFKPLIEDLAEEGIEVVIQAGQVMKGEDKNLAEENVKLAIGLAKEYPEKIRIMGLEAGFQSNDLRELAKKQIIASVSSDIETSHLSLQVEDVSQHPLIQAGKDGIEFTVAAPHLFFPSSVVLEATAAALAIYPPPKIKGSFEQQIQLYQEFYLPKVQAFLA